MGVRALFMGEQIAQAFWGRCVDTDQCFQCVPTSDLVMPGLGIIQNACRYLCSTISDCDVIYNSKSLNYLSIQ